MMVADPESVCRVALGAVFISTAAIGIPHRLRADRVGGKVSVQADPKWFWILMMIAGPPMALVCLAFIVQPRWVDFGQLGLEPRLRLAGIPVAVAGVSLFGWMFRHLGLNVTSTSLPRANAKLVTTGPYRWIRHPMYSAALLLVMAATLLTANVVVAIGGALMFLLMAARSRLEETRLVAKFGEDYRAYQRSTGRFLPHWR